MLAAASDPSASHNCYAWRLSALEARASDDGEPGGTAGRPILAAIEAAGLEGVCVVVTRYYGGTKLGTGGLARAYGGAAAAALAEGERKAVRAMRLGVLEGFESRDLGAVYAWAFAPWLSSTSTCTVRDSQLALCDSKRMALSHVISAAAGSSATPESVCVRRSESCLPSVIDTRARNLTSSGSVSVIMPSSTCTATRALSPLVCSVLLGETLMTKKIKVPELVRSWAKNGAASYFRAVPSSEISAFLQTERFFVGSVRACCSQGA